MSLSAVWESYQPEGKSSYRRPTDEERAAMKSDARAFWEWAAKPHQMFEKISLSFGGLHPCDIYTLAEDGDNTQYLIHHHGYEIRNMIGLIPTIVRNIRETGITIRFRWEQ